MAKYTANELENKFKERLKSQRRIFTFDENQILVLPFLEHPDLNKSVQEIRFLINDLGEFIPFKEIENIEITREFIILSTSNNKYKLHQRMINGKIEPIVPTPSDNDLSQLTIEHSPSIQIVLLSKYLSEDKAFTTIANFTILNGTKLNAKDIKSKGFKNKCETILKENQNQIVIKEAYELIFKDITLEILHKSMNGANLSIESLNYYIKNTHNMR